MKKSKQVGQMILTVSITWGKGSIWVANVSSPKIIINSTGMTLDAEEALEYFDDLTTARDIHNFFDRGY